MSKQRRKRGREAAPATIEKTSAWQRLSDGQQHLVCVVVLLAVSLAFFAPVHFTGGNLIGGDTVGWRAQAESMIEYRAEAGEEALWANNAFGGMPGYMISYPTLVPQLDSIPRALRSFLWPTSHFIFLLLGTYLLVFFVARDKLAGVLAACAYGLTTYIPVILVAGHNSKFVALSFVPWLALAFAYAIRRPKVLSALLFAMALAVNLRAGHVQITYYAAFLLGIWWIVEGVLAFRKGRLKDFGVSTAWLALGSVLGLLMVAQPYLANFEYKDFTIRGAASGGEVVGGLDWTYAMGWSQGLGELVTLLVPHAYGGGGGLYWGGKPFTAGPHYVGGIVVLLAVLALWRLRKGVVWGFGLGAFVMVLFSLGEHFEALNRFMYDHFPLFAAFRVPETWLSVVAFALAVLAALGLGYAVRREPDRAAETQRTRSVYFVSVAVIAFTALLFVARGALFSFERPGEYEQAAQQVAQANNVSPQDPRVQQAVQSYMAEQDAARQDAFAGDALRTLFFLVAAGALLAAYRRGKMPAWALQGALALLVVIDLWGVDRRYLSDTQLFSANAIEERIETFDYDRFLMQRLDEAGGPGHFRVLSFERGDPFVNARPSYHFESVGGYHGAKLRLYQDYIEHILPGSEPGIPNENALDLLNTRYIVAGWPMPGTEIVYQGERAYVLENTDALPRAFLVGETEVIEGAEATWARLRSPDYDPRRTALLPAPLEAEVTPIDSASTAEATVERYTPREIDVAVETDAPRLLVLSEVYYPAGWNAYVDGVAVPIQRVDYLLRAVPVPAGTHTVTFRFEPRSHALGLWLSGASTVLVYGATLLLLGLAWRRRDAAADAPPPEETTGQA